jgi:uncharacterized repeat protein (TIGR01451 family)
MIRSRVDTLPACASVDRSMDEPGSSGRTRLQASMLPLSIAAALGSLLSGPAQAQLFPPEIELSSLDGQIGFFLNGVLPGDRSGNSVSAAGDINGDGIDDLVVGAPLADPNGDFSGIAYVVFGSNSGFPTLFNLSSLDGSNGFSLNGENEQDYSGIRVRPAGDVNGDGIDDLLVGNLTSSYGAGRAHLVFGSSEAWPQDFELSSLNGVNGVTMIGEASNDGMGRVLEGAGDINGDGVDDVILGASSSTPSSGAFAGRSYVVFGSSAGLPNPLLLSSLDGSNGFVLEGEASSDRSGFSVAGIGDVNGDGIDDLSIGAPRNSENGFQSGRAYVVFGRQSSFPAVFGLGSVNGLNGFLIEGISGDLGWVVSDAGDFNADGLADLIVTAPLATADMATAAGKAAIVFGSTLRFPSPFDLSTLDGSNGVIINGALQFDQAGYAADVSGDVNGDGIDDVIIGSVRADPNGSESGRAFVVFGSGAGLTSPIELSGLDGTNGFALNGEDIDDRAGQSVAFAGDLNHDGIDDLVVGAPRASAIPILNPESGRSYVIYGRSSLDVAVSKTNGQAYVPSAAATTYVIDAFNTSPADVQGVTLSDPLPPTLDASTATWTCSASGGAVCPNASGTGSLSETVDLPSGSMLSYQLTAVVLATEGEEVVNTASLILPNGLTDLDASNNSATDRDVVGLFADGFEIE